jgi:hypothetical protein
MESRFRYGVSRAVSDPSRRQASSRSSGKPSINEISGERPRKIDRELGMPRQRADRLCTLSMRIADPVSERAKAFDSSSYPTEYLLEYLLGVLARCDVELLSCRAVERRQVILLAIRRAGLIEDVFADGLKESPSSRDRTLRVGVPAVESFLPHGMDAIRIEIQECVGCHRINWRTVRAFKVVK